MDRRNSTASQSATKKHAPPSKMVLAMSPAGSFWKAARSLARSRTGFCRVGATRQAGRWVV